jgi:endonuclease/exonuclease/phosphatase family metal-dependent hydrolase
VDTPAASERARWAERVGDQTLHGRLLAELTCLHELELEPGSGAALQGWVRVAAWNAERGRDVAGATALLRRCRADLLLLSELDSGVARTGNVDVPRALAQSLETGYGFGVEFIELAGNNGGDGDNGQNERGLHGNAILTAAPLEQPEVVRLGGDGAWFAAGSTEPRVGGRMAVVGTAEVDGTRVRVASTHLENMTDPDGRAAQLGVLFDAMGPGPAIVGGDLNTFGAPLLDLTDRAAVRRLRGEDPARFSWPVAYEPLFEVARARGFQWVDANIAAPTTSHDAAGLPDHVPLKLDWILVRGLEARRPAVTPCGDLSDHQVVSVAVRIPTGTS